MVGRRRGTGVSLLFSLACDRGRERSARCMNERCIKEDVRSYKEQRLEEKKWWWRDRREQEAGGTGLNCSKHTPWAEVV